jgi:FkbM family methyltransferase
MFSTNDYNTLIETFVSQQYLWLISGLRPNTIAIDIGAHCGDSAIYLAQQNGIEKVFAYDNDENVAVRGINMLNKATQKVREKIRYSLAEVVGDETLPKGFVLQVPHVSLAGILENIHSPVVIKCDCEGAEHRIFGENMGDAMQHVYRIQIEYHNGAQNLKARLEKSGFKVTVAKPWTHDAKLGEVGWLYAEK